MKSETTLLRQVHPAWIQNDTITSQVFKPTPKDEKKLSVYDGDQITAEEAWQHFTVQQKLQSIGVMAVSVSEVSSQGLQAIPDPTPYPEHVYIDFSNLSENQISKTAKQLKSYAVTRGWLYRPDA